MRIYNDKNVDLFYVSAYTRMKIVPKGIQLSHTITGKDVILSLDKNKVSTLWHLLENGTDIAELEQRLLELENGFDGILELLIQKGFIE